MKKEDKNNAFSKSLEIEIAVIKTFLAILKRRKLYQMFRMQLPFTNGSNKVLHVPSNSSSPFKECKSLNDVANKLVQLTKEVGLADNVFAMDRYDRVTANINHLLHFIVETVLPMEELSKMGQEIFDASCFALFGDTIDDVVAEPKDVKVPAEGTDVGIVLGGHMHDEESQANSVDWFQEMLKSFNETTYNTTGFSTNEENNGTWKMLNR